MRVFISSTCYDLIDLRAELEVFLKDTGVEPVMSDSMSSDFQISHDRNSIETCLANIRSCEHFIIILSNRYGPSLKNAGYEDISATHLEYREAKKHKIPIHMFVRDRLEADFSIWKSNDDKQRLKLSWCKNPSDHKIFDLMKEHRELSDKANNWFWVFRNSIELKDRIRLEFKSSFENYAVRSLFNDGNLPLFEISIKFNTTLDVFTHFSISIKNIGLGVAISPDIVIGPDQSPNTNNRWQVATLFSRDTAELNISWHIFDGTVGVLETQITYSTIQGYMFCDLGTISYSYNVNGFEKTNKANYKLKKRSYLGLSDANVLIAPV